MVATVSASPDPTRVVELSPTDVLAAAGNREITPDSVTDLTNSIGRDGQLVPGIVYPHPELPGKFVCVEGNRRLLATRILGIPFKAVVLSHAPSDIELLRLRLSTNVIRKAMTGDEIAADIRRYMAAANATQDAAAEFFGFSPGYVSKLLAPARRLIPELRCLSENPAIGHDVLRIVATMPTPELQMQLAERMQDVLARGGRLKRDLVERLAAELKGGNGHRKPPTVRVIKDGTCFVFPGDWPWERLAKFLGELAEVARREARRDGKPALPVSTFPRLL